MVVLFGVLIAAIGIIVMVVGGDSAVNEIENIGINEKLKGLHDEDYTPNISTSPSGGQN